MLGESEIEKSEDNNEYTTKQDSIIDYDELKN